jgi:hypothetical protein
MLNHPIVPRAHLPYIGKHCLAYEQEIAKRRPFAILQFPPVTPSPARTFPWPIPLSSLKAIKSRYQFTTPRGLAIGARLAGMVPSTSAAQRLSLRQRPDISLCCRRSITHSQRHTNAKQPRSSCATSILSQSQCHRATTSVARSQAYPRSSILQIRSKPSACGGACHPISSIFH